jgi:hypothetical protein
VTLINATRTKGIFLVQLGATATRPTIDAWIARFRAKMATVDRTAFVRSVLVGNKGGVVLSIDAGVATTAALDLVISKTRTAMGTGTAAITTL